MSNQFANEVGASVATAAMQNATVQNAVKQEAKNQFWSSMGFSKSQQQQQQQQQQPGMEMPIPMQVPTQDGYLVDESVIQGIDDAELARIEGWAKKLRVAMILVSTLCIITAFYNLANTSNTVATNFLAIYVFFFSTLVCCYEIAVKQIVIIIVQNFGFLYNPIGRTIFICFLAVLLFQLSTMGMVMFAVLLAMGIVQIYVDCRHPKFEKYKMVINYFGRASAQFRAPPPMAMANPATTV
jgi:hypothetical protein